MNIMLSTQEESEYFRALVEFIDVMKYHDIRQVQHDLNNLAADFKVCIHPASDYMIKGRAG